MYCYINGDIGRVYHGYDDCGYICGFQNKPMLHPDICTHRADKSETP